MNTNIQNFIDCDADPIVFPGWLSLEQHRKGGMLKWNIAKFMLHIVKEQESSRHKYIVGDYLREKLYEMAVMNANVLDYLLANPHLIPEEWKIRRVFFWGTIYRDEKGSLFVRYLFWRKGEWRWYAKWLGDHWGELDPAAILVS